jgi:uncharacterized membrane protein YccC
MSPVQIVASVVVGSLVLLIYARWVNEKEGRSEPSLRPFLSALRKRVENLIQSNWIKEQRRRILDVRESILELIEDPQDKEARLRHEEWERRQRRAHLL